MEAEGITVRQTAVGDRYVLEEMRAGGFNLGGEQSGHVVLADHATTGDGVLTGLMLLSRMAETGRSLADLAAVVERLPQVLVNVADVDKARAGDDEQVAAAVARRAGRARRPRAGCCCGPSGTEALVRVMVEASDAAQAQAVADRLALVVRERLSLS